MTDKNAVDIIGSMTDEPMYRETSNKSPMATFTVSVRRRLPSTASDFLNVVVWRNQIEETRRFHKGDRVEVKGCLRKSYFIGNDGNRRNVVQIIADEVREPEEEFDASPQEMPE